MLRRSLWLLAPVLAYGQGAQLPKYNVGNLPLATSYPSYTVQVLDGLNAQDCVTGGGTKNVLCTSRGGAWVPVSPFQSLTTTGSSGPATLNFGVLNIPVYAGGSSSQSIENFVNLPSTDQHVIIHPTCASFPSCAVDNNPRTVSTSATGASSGVITLTSQLGSFPPAQGLINFTSATLPSYVNPASVSAVYAYSINSINKNGSDGVNCGITNVSTSNSPVLTGLTGFNVTSTTCTAEISNSLASPQGGTFTIADVGFIVYYTGTAPPADTNTIVSWPILYTNYNQTLSLDPNFPGLIKGVTTVAQIGTKSVLIEKGNFYAVTDSATTSGLCNSGSGTNQVLCYSDGTNWNIYAGGGGGGGGLSGQVANYLPKATTSTTSTGPSIISDDGTTATVHGPVQITGTGAGAFQPAVGTDPGGVAGTATYTTDPTNGYAEVHEGTGALSRICTATNGICAGSSFITSLTTTGSSGAATVSGGVLNIPVYSSGSGLPTGYTNPASGKLYGTASDTYTGTTTYGYLQSVLNGLNLQTEYRLSQTGDSVSAIAGGELIPSTATNHQANAVMGLIHNQSTATNAVAVYGWGTCDVISGQCWGSNFGVSDSPSKSATLIAQELDANVGNTGTGVYGLYVNAAFTAQPATANGVVVDCTACVAGKRWNTGFWSKVATTNFAGFLADRVETGPNQTSQTYSMYSTNGAGAILKSDIFSDTSGAIVLSSNSGTTKVANLNISGTCTGCGSFTNPMTTLGDAIYGGASGVGTRLAGPTTTGHLFLYGWTPSGSAIAPTAYDFGANAATYIKATSPIVATQNANDVTISCPTCGTSTATAVNNNGAATLGTSQQDGTLPYICADSSGSGTAQTCSTATSFTVTSGNCFVYKTTTTNSGTGLTVNANSLGAKSVAIPGASGWTTTLTASIIPANKPLLMCYDGTNLNVQQTGTASTGGSGNYTNITGSVTPTGCAVSSGQCVVGTPGTTIDLASIPSTYRTIEIRITAQSSNATATNMWMQVNSDTGTNYTTQYNATSGTTVSAGQTVSNGTPGLFFIESPTAFAGAATQGKITLDLYAGTSFKKNALATQTTISGSAATSIQTQSVGWFWNSTAAINEIKLGMASGNFTAGTSVSIYGVN